MQQELGERDTHLPSTGELLGSPLPVLLAEPQTAQHRSYLGIKGIDVMRMHEIADLGVAIRGGGVLLRLGVGLAHGGHQLLVLAFQGAQLIEHRKALFKDGTS